MGLFLVKFLDDVEAIVARQLKIGEQRVVGVLRARENPSLPLTARVTSWPPPSSASRITVARASSSSIRRFGPGGASGPILYLRIGRKSNPTPTLELADHDELFQSQSTSPARFPLVAAGFDSGENARDLVAEAYGRFELLGSGMLRVAVQNKPSGKEVVVVLLEVMDVSGRGGWDRYDREISSGRGELRPPRCPASQRSWPRRW